ncbi:Nudix hydrolase 26 [Citrus sinensis]|uniref:Nudix hydrolase 26 n=1 Tax=Citrus sinensis TaxID=2711 RepID=A0ACB8L7B4_CITSI|nr:Nudix hydrolase 26 [Citrus sinensis]KAH9769170.1 Nudix hydrolase 26 [Citrus sinensis]
MDAPPEGYRRNVGICLINSSKKIFAASRLDIPDSWQMPQGGIDENEDPKVAALRELKEETGVSSAEVLAEVPYWLTYDFPPEVREKLKHQWGGDWKGQAQKWFLLKFTGKEEEINLLGDKSEKPEFGEWKWMSPEQILERVSIQYFDVLISNSFEYLNCLQAVDFKKPVYKEVFTVFTPHLQ